MSVLSYNQYVTRWRLKLPVESPVKDTVCIDDEPVPFVPRFNRHDRPRALTILVTPASTTDLGDLVRFKLAARPFIRDVVSDRILVFWQLMEPEGAYLL